MTDEFASIELPLIVSSLTNPRKTFHADRLAELAESIKASGVHQPILVRRLPGSRVADTDRSVQYEIVSGERRYRATQMAGLGTIPALIRPLTDDQVLECQIVENLQRDDLTELEEAEGYQALMNHSHLTAEDVGTKIGKSRSYVYGRLKLLEACTEVRTALREGTIDASRTLLLARIPDPKLQIKALEEISSTDYAGDLEMGYRTAAAYIQREYMLHLDKARFKITDAALLPEAGSCKACAKRTGHNPDLFSDVKGADVCTDPPCFHRKEAAHSEAMLKAAHDRGQTIIEGREAKALMPNSWGSVEGYLRLDNAQDSPTDQPLRALLGKQLDDVVPVLIANPHKEGDLIAVLPSTQVAELLKASGRNEATGAAVEIDRNQASKAKADKAKQDAQLKTDFEQGWRTLLMERTWAAVRASDEYEPTWMELERFHALHYAKNLNADKCKTVCKLLDLGKVAPSAALIDHIEETEEPQKVLQLLIMLRDVEYRHWLKDDANEGLFLIADAYPSIDLLAIKAECKKALQDKVKTSKTAAKKCNLENPPAAQQTQSGSSATKARAPKKKLSAEEAKSGIAAAMQSQDQAQTAAPETKAIEVTPILAVGSMVVVTDNVERLSPKTQKFAGKRGRITEPQGDRAWWVTFTGKSGSLAKFATFDKSELRAVAA